MNEIAAHAPDNVPDNVALRRLGIVILAMCGITVGLIIAVAIVSFSIR
jgi:hypothetical protein